MLVLNVTSQFRKDYKRIKKQGKDLSLLEGIIDCLLAEATLPQKHHDHALSGNMLALGNVIYSQIGFSCTS